MAKDPIGMALSAVNRMAGNPWLDRLGLRKSAEQLAYTGTRTGFQLMNNTQQRFRQLRGLLPARRLPRQAATDLFDLNLTDDQQMIVDSLRRLAEDQIRPVAAQADESASVPEALHKIVQEIGLNLYAIPEDFGGVAEVQSPLTSVLIAEALAWGDMGIAQAMLSTFSVAQILVQWGDGRQQARYLPDLCQAEPAFAAIAIDEPRPLFSPDQLHTRARRTAHGYVLNGLKSAVPLAASADLFVVAAQLENEGPRLFLIERSTPGLAWRPEPAMGLRPASLGQLALNDVALAPEDLIGGSDTFDYPVFLDRAALMRCALAIGGAQAALDYVIPYCNQREAFGEPISHRQSVAFIIADMAIELESMRLLTWRAASRADQGLDFHEQTAQARLICNEKAMEIGTQAVQLLGGHGFIKEHPVERWYRDLRSTATLFGGLQA